MMLYQIAIIHLDPVLYSYWWFCMTVKRRVEFKLLVVRKWPDCCAFFWVAFISFVNTSCLLPIPVLFIFWNMEEDNSEALQKDDGDMYMQEQVI